MRTINELAQRLQSDVAFEQKFTLESTDKIHLLYVSPKLNASGYYRMIAPAMELNKTNTHEAKITFIQKNDFGKQFSDAFEPLDERLIRWADYIILPTIMDDIYYLLQLIRSINPNIQLVMDMDRQYFLLPKYLPISHKITPQKQRVFIQNLLAMDLIITPINSLVNSLQKFLLKHNKNTNTLVQKTPTLISNLAYEEVPPLLRNTEKKTRIALIEPLEEEWQSLKETLVKTEDSHKESIQLVIFGTAHLLKESLEFLKEIRAEIHKSVNFINYFNTLNELALDIVLLPAKKHIYNSHKISTTFLEVSVFGIPCIISPYHAAVSLAKHNETALIVSQDFGWGEAIQQLVKNISLRKQLGQNALKRAWKHYSYSSKNLRPFTELFI